MVEEDIYLLRLKTILFEELVIGHALAHLMYPVNIFDVMAVLCINLNDAVH